LLFDTNVLVYAADEASEFHTPCTARLEEARNNPSSSFLTWNVCYEFLRITTHLGAPRILFDPQAAQRFLSGLLNSPGFSVLCPTDRHADVLSQTLLELPWVRGNVFFDLHTAVLMRENGISEICTRDSDFLRFPFLTVIDPLR
jgi:predicted nucleic acid-binding protein